MKTTTNLLIAAAVTGALTALPAIARAASPLGVPGAAADKMGCNSKGGQKDSKEKESCQAKDEQGKAKKKGQDKDKDKASCAGKEGCGGKDKQ